MLTGDWLMMVLALWVITLCGGFFTGFVTGFFLGYLWRG